MKTDIPDNLQACVSEDSQTANARNVLNSNIGDSIDLLVEYLVENNIEGIHPLIMGEVERRLIVKVLERSRGNKLQAARWLGMSRNTFHRKVQRLIDRDSDA